MRAGVELWSLHCAVCFLPTTSPASPPTPTLPWLAGLHSSDLGGGWVCLCQHCCPHELSQEMWAAGEPEDAASRLCPCPRQKPLPPDGPLDLLVAFWSPDLSNSTPRSYLLEHPRFPTDCFP